ncbi:PTCHD3 [Bugula neritina]|uniref:PTCHD3 n=1 Tax=Bugula neritina TaxID=10212 RepID=A0A7J7J3W6_BUGNE|nr:PTCHD3 [Bugula neritina]
MVKDFASEPSVKTSSVDSWLENYLEWLSNTKCPWIKSHIDTSADPRLPLDERRFNMLLTPFVYMTAVGRRHIRNVNFNETITFGDGNGTDGDFNLTNVISSSGNLSNPNLTTPDILDMERDFAARYLTSTRIPFEFVNLESSTVSVEAMDDTRKVVGNYFTDDEVFPFSRSFENWETDKIIQMELYRNMALAFGCVVVLTLFLIADIGTCLLVSFCVLSTLVEVAGLMYFWNLSIDTVTCIQLVLAIGLAVDYSAHIGHTFMTVTGTRNERAMKTLADIGPAVFNGGFSTLLAFMLLASSDSYVFDVFFKVNLLVVLLGMWNGMVLLPVLLSLIGPAPYLSTLNTRRTSSITKISNLAADNDTFQPDDVMEKPVPDANETNKESLHDAENGMMPPQYDTVADRSDKPLTDSSPNQDNDLPAVV